MKTVGDVLDKIMGAHIVKDRLEDCNDEFVGPVLREELIEILEDYCETLRRIPVKQ